MPHGTRVGRWSYKDEDGTLCTEENALLVPVYKNGELVSMQGILPDGTKSCSTKARNKSFTIPLVNTPIPSYFARDGLQVRPCTKRHNYSRLCQLTQVTWFMLRSIYARNTLYAVSWYVPIMTNTKKSNTGLKSAYKASCAVDADVVYPIFSDVTNKPTDFNDCTMKLAIIIRYMNVGSTYPILCKGYWYGLFQCFWFALHWWCWKGTRRIKRAFWYCQGCFGGRGSYVGQSTCIYEYRNHP